MNTVTLVYIGVRQLNNGKLGHKYLERLEDGSFSERNWLFARELVKGQGYGTILKVQTEGELVKGPRERCGWIEDETLLTKWAAISRAEEGAYKEAKKISNRDMENPVFQRLKPLREIYRQLPAVRRRHMLADIIRHITG